MPILKQEPDAFPAEIFDVPVAEMSWHVACVRSRQEKVPARYLHGALPYYLPQCKQVRARQGRRFSSWVPLFSGYVFFRGTGDALRLAVRSNVVACFLEVSDQDRLHGELLQLYTIQSEGGVLEPWPGLAVGDEVAIREGPFEGYCGVIVRERESTRLIVSIESLGKSVSVELGRRAIRPAGYAAALGRATRVACPKGQPSIS